MRKVSDETFNAVRARWGEKGLLELTAVMGVYTMNATILRAMDHRPATGRAAPDAAQANLICRRAASCGHDAANVGRSTVATGGRAMGKETGNMSILVIGGAGFIGRRMIPILAAAGHDVTCVDIDVAGATAAFARLGGKVKVVRGDVTQFDDVIGAVQELRAERLINLSYFIGELAPHVAFKLDVQGMDNCFEAARRCGVKHTVFASSVAVTGQQAHFGERLVDETESGAARPSTPSTRSSTSGRRTTTAAPTA